MSLHIKGLSAPTPLRSAMTGLLPPLPLEKGGTLGLPLVASP